MISRFCRFVGVGAAATFIQYLILIIFVRLGTFAAIGTFVGYLGGAVFSYFANYRFTFISAKAHQDAMPKFMCVVTVGITINTAIVALLADQLGMNYIFAQVVATGTTLLTNFLGHEFWSFRTRVASRSNL